MVASKEDLIKACENAIQYFEGVPAAIVPDNLKAAVTRSDRNEPVINDDFAAAVGLLYIIACIRFLGLAGFIGGCVVGVFFLFFHHYSCRTHLEICNLGLYSTHYSRYGIGL